VCVCVEGQKETVSTSANDFNTRPYRFYGRSATELNKGRRSRDVGSALAVALHGITPYRVRQPKPKINKRNPFHHSICVCVCVCLFRVSPNFFLFFFLFLFSFFLLLFVLGPLFPTNTQRRRDRKAFLFSRITHNL
jgi:hypothetical protein